MAEKILYEAHPAMFKNNPIGFIISIILIPTSIGIIILLKWYLRVKAEKLTITDEKIVKRTGTFSKYTTDVYHSDVRNVQIKQSFFQRMFKVGTIAIASAGTGGIEIVIEGIPNPEKVKRIFEEQRRKLRGQFS